MADDVYGGNFPQARAAIIDGHLTLLCKWRQWHKERTASSFGMPTSYQPQDKPQDTVEIGGQNGCGETKNGQCPYM